MYIDSERLKFKIKSEATTTEIVGHQWVFTPLDKLLGIIDRQPLAISKKLFVECIRAIRDKWDAECKACEVGVNLIDMPSCEQATLDLLRLITGKGDLISWWCYEKDFGREFKIGDLTDNEASPDLTTAEKLYDYISSLRHDKINQYQNTLSSIIA